MALAYKWRLRGVKLLNSSGSIALRSLLIGLIDALDTPAARIEWFSQCSTAFADMSSSDIEATGRDVIRPLLHKLLQAMSPKDAERFLNDFDDFRPREQV